MDSIMTEEEMLAKFPLSYHEFIKRHFDIIKRSQSYNMENYHMYCINRCLICHEITSSQKRLNEFIWFRREMDLIYKKKKYLNIEN